MKIDLSMEKIPWLNFERYVTPYRSLFSGVFAFAPTIPKNHYLIDEFRLRLPGLQEFIVHKGGGCYIHKKDFKRSYQQFPTDPKDYK